jgi:hypothetical protein
MNQKVSPARGAGRALRLVSRRTTTSASGDAFQVTLSDLRPVLTTAGYIPRCVAKEIFQLAARHPHFDENDLRRAEHLASTYPGSAVAVLQCGEGVH